MDEHTRRDEHTKTAGSLELNELSDLDDGSLEIDDRSSEIDDGSSEIDDGSSEIDDESAKLAGLSEVDESPKVTKYSKMDEHTRARYEKWKRNRIKKRIILPGVGILCVFILVWFVIEASGSGGDVTESIEESVEESYAAKLADRAEFESSQIEKNDPIIYLFNSHPREKIGSYYYNQTVGDMNIVEITHILAEHLESYDVSTLVEQRCVDTILRENNWKFNMSYSVSRDFLQDVMNRYPNLEFFVDIHRDGIPHEYATVEIDGVNYAQILFIIGLDNPVGYDANYAGAIDLHYMLEERKPGISRRVYFSGNSSTKNGVYNQDLSPMVQLIEIGTVTSTVEEVLLTTEILAEVLAEYVLQLNED